MEHRTLEITGIVQGVGFRPFVARLARALGLAGEVRNVAGVVQLEVEGPADSVARFLERVIAEAPPQAQIARVLTRRGAPRGFKGFAIAESRDLPAHGEVYLSPDIATCDDCLAELFNPADRRYRYPFLNCTQCGPRLTILRRAPYDRANTSLAGFPLCEACRREFEDPLNRRYHAQPIACPACGPHVELRSPARELLAAGEPLRAFAAALRAGRIGALKGLGGYHLACRADSAEAVAALRRRKRREQQPFAVMVRNLARAAALCEMSPQEAALLTSPRRPIVLLRRAAHGAGAICREVAPRSPDLGLMLPYTPLHHLLLEELNGIPLVMTSGNYSGEPLAHQDDDAFSQLGELADLFLTHNREILVGCDDSVTRVVAGREQPIRRARGEAPRPLPLAFAAPAPLLAVGGQLKATFALARGDRAFLSQHLGDLDHPAALAAYERMIAFYEQLLRARPAAIVHDLHPEYASTRYARRRAEAEGLPLIGVQHHHAHLASLLAEHGRANPVLGVVWDGAGYGESEDDRSAEIWGGEFLFGGLAECNRVGRFRTVGMPGGEAAIREPWRMAYAYLLDAGCDSPEFMAELEPAARRLIPRMLERGVNSPRTSSAGRLFDAVAALLGLRRAVSFEGQAAMELEGLAARGKAGGTYPFEFSDPPRAGLPVEVDTRPLIRELMRELKSGVERAEIARRFHETLAEMVVQLCRRLGRRLECRTAALSGGVFHNALLSERVVDRLESAGWEVLRHRWVPPGDGGLSLGQLAVAGARLGTAALEDRNPRADRVRSSSAIIPAGEKPCA